MTAGTASGVGAGRGAPGSRRALSLLLLAVMGPELAARASGVRLVREGPEPGWGRCCALDAGTAGLAVLFNVGVVSFLVPLIQRGIARATPGDAPMVMPLAPELGLSEDRALVWLGILFVMNIRIYSLSPPFGWACFRPKSVAPKQISPQEIVVSVLPRIALQIVGLVLVMLFPQIALWLPEALN